MVNGFSVPVQRNLLDSARAIQFPGCTRRFGYAEREVGEDYEHTHLFFMVQ